MVFDMTDPYCTLVLRGIENTLYQSSYLPILTDVHNERSRFERYLEMLLDRRIEALIVLANWLFLDINLLGDLEKSSIPTAMIGCELEHRLHQFHHRRQRGRRPAWRSSICTPSDIARSPSSAGPKRSLTVLRAGAASATARKQCGLELDPRLIMDLPESRDPISSFEAGYKLTEDLIRQKRPFTALLAFDDMSAFGAIRALTQAGIRVPEHCSVIGFDDVATSAIYTPSLTTIRQPMESMGASAVGIVVSTASTPCSRNGRVGATHRKVAPGTRRARVHSQLAVSAQQFR